MSEISAQVSLYPLGQVEIDLPIRAVWEALAVHGVRFEPGPMSTLVQGESHALFEALEAAFARAAQYGNAVMTVTVSNACPVTLPPEPPPSS
jgi:uncharacterized protein YqgV (UPF0045/DUF77 family)